MFNHYPVERESYDHRLKDDVEKIDLLSIQPKEQFFPPPYTYIIKPVQQQGGSPFHEQVQFMQNQSMPSFHEQAQFMPYENGPPVYEQAQQTPTSNAGFISYFYDEKGKRVYGKVFTTVSQVANAFQKVTPVVHQEGRLITSFGNQ